MQPNLIQNKQQFGSLDNMLNKFIQFQWQPLKNGFQTLLLNKE